MTFKSIAQNVYQASNILYQFAGAAYYIRKGIKLNSIYHIQKCREHCIYITNFFLDNGQLAFAKDWEERTERIENRIEHIRVCHT